MNAPAAAPEDVPSEPLSGPDTSWLRMDSPTNSMTIHALFTFDRPFTVEALRTLLAQRLVPFRRFRQRVVIPAMPGAHPHWEWDPHFTVERHVFADPLDATDEDSLKAHVNRVISDQPLDFAQSLWEIRLLEGPEGGRHILWRVHHCLADGFAHIYLMLALVDDPGEVELPIGPTPPPPLPYADRRRQRRPRKAFESLRRLMHYRPHLPSPKVVAQWAQALSRTPQTVQHLLTLSPEPDTPLHVDLCRTKRVAWTRARPLAEVKEAAHRHGGTLNDLLLAILTGALRRFLLDHEVPLAGHDLRVVIPVNLAPLGARKDPFGNGFGLVFLKLPVGAPTLDSRIAELKRHMDDLKRSPEALLAFGLLRLAGYLPEAAQQAISDIFFKGRATAVCTNVPGPKTRISMGGRIVEDLVFWVPSSIGAGLGLSIFSYAGAVRVGVIADAQCLEDPEELVRDFEREYESIVHGGR